MPDEIRRKLPDEVVDELLADGARTEEEIVGSGGLFVAVDSAVGERALEVELTLSRQ